MALGDVVGRLKGFKKIAWNAGEYNWVCWQMKWVIDRDIKQPSGEPGPYFCRTGSNLLVCSPFSPLDMTHKTDLYLNSFSSLWQLYWLV